MRFARSTALFLRFVAIVQILTFGLCFLPEPALASLYSWVGFGKLPHLPFFLYVIRGASYCQGAIGVLLWVIATDVVRYRPLVIATAAIYLLGAPAFYVIHIMIGMPRWWTIMDTVSCFLVGAVLLALCLFPSAHASRTANAV